MTKRQQHWFELRLPDEVVRKMTRAEYYAARSYTRRVRRAMVAEMAARGRVGRVMRDTYLYGAGLALDVGVRLT